jgi:DNA-binding transcriptional ArsR family regulator
LVKKIEDIFSSKGRVRILKILSEIGELNISEIAKRAKLNYTSTNQHFSINTVLYRLAYYDAGYM